VKRSSTKVDEKEVKIPRLELPKQPPSKIRTGLALECKEGHEMKI